MTTEGRDDALQGKICLVTGGSKGMGRSFCRALIAAEAKVAIIARPSEELDRSAAEFGERAVAIAGDITDADAIERGVAQAVERFGRLDAVVSNAATTSLLKLEGASRSAIEREIAVNMMGPIHLTRTVIPHLRASGGGDLVFVSSESVRLPYPYLTLYAAAKAGIETFAAGMRNELRENGTRVTVLRSGSVGGTSIEERWDPAVRDRFFEACVAAGMAGFSGQPATAETMAKALVSLLSLPRDVNVDLIEIRGR